MTIRYTTDDIDAKPVTPEMIGTVQEWKIYIEDDERPHATLSPGTYVGELVSCLKFYPNRILTFRDGFRIYASAT